MDSLNQYNDIKSNNDSNLKKINDTGQKYSNHSMNDTAKNDSYLQPEAKPPIKKKTQDLSKLITTFAAIVSATLIGISGIGDIFVQKATTKAIFYDVWASVNEVFCSFELENYDENEKYSVVLSNDFTNRVQIIEDNAFEGWFENLQTNMTYTITIKQGNIAIASRTIRTTERKNESDEPITSDDETQNPSGNGGYTNG